MAALRPEGRVMNPQADGSSGSGSAWGPLREAGEARYAIAQDRAPESKPRPVNSRGQGRA